MFRVYVDITSSVNAFLRFIFLGGRGEQPLSPTINVVPFRTAWWAACNPSIWEVEVGGSPVRGQPQLVTQRVRGQPGVLEADLLKTKQNKNPQQQN